MAVQYKCAKCADYGDIVMVATYTLNRRNGNRCMCCGGFMIPDSKIAEIVAKRGASHRNKHSKNIIKSFK
jgi:hypothetical protein